MLPTFYKDVFRILPYKRCTDRMIKKNYYRENVSLGFTMDFEMGWAGHPSPYREEIQHKKNVANGIYLPKYYVNVCEEMGKAYSDYNAFEI